MSKVKRFSLVVLSALVCLFGSFVFTGCKEESKTCKLYVFSSVGGCVQVEDNEEMVEFGDEGSKVFTYKEGNKVSLKAIPNKGYKFVKWRSTDAANQVATMELSFKITDDGVVVKAEFEKDDLLSRTINYAKNQEGYTIQVESGYSNIVGVGGDFKFKVILKDDYSNSNITVKANNKVISAVNNIYTISDIQEDITITVEGVELNEEIPNPPTSTTVYGIYTQDTRFTIKPLSHPTCEVLQGESFRFKIEPAEGYRLESDVAIQAKGEAVRIVNGEYLIESVNRNVEISIAEGIVEDIVVPEITKYTITASGDNYMINPDISSGYQVDENSSFTFSITINQGYKKGDDFKVLAGETELVESEGQYTIDNINTDIVILVEGIVEDAKDEETEILYAFSLAFEESVKTDEDILLSIPESISFSIKEEDKRNQYNTDEFIVSYGQGQTITIKKLIENIQESSLFSLQVSHFEIAGFTFIQINGEVMTVNWDVLSLVDNIYDLIIVMK